MPLIGASSMNRLLLLVTAIACLVVPAQAQPTGADRDLVAFEQRFRAANPNTRIDAIAPSAIPGLFEVVMGKNVAYVEPSGRYALFGHLYDMQAQRDLTADRKTDLDRVDVRLLPRDLAIRTVRGSGERTLFVFSDPQCGFCKALEQSLVELDNVTVYTFLTPILGPESKRLAAAISCSPVPAEAWAAWMRKSEQPRPAAAGCAGNGEAVEKLAQSLGVSGTPTLVASDGRKNAGAMSAQQLTAWLSPGTKTASTGAPASATPKTPPR